MIKFDTEPNVFTDFYKSRCGRITSKIISQHILSLWSDTKDMNILAIGWPFPYLHHFQETAERVICATPHYSPKEIENIPQREKIATTLVNINELPFPAHFFDRILIIHGAEYSTDILDLLDNVEQLLADNGRIITIIPNRSGLWRKKTWTPFSYGAAFTAGQLQWSLKQVGFDVNYYSAALAFPPTQSHHILSLSTKWEGIGRNIFPFLSGVHIIEGHKNLYAGAIRKPILQKFALPIKKLEVVTE